LKLEQKERLEQPGWQGSSTVGDIIHILLIKRKVRHLVLFFIPIIPSSKQVATAASLG
jgi:hypothetical protein